MESFRFEKTDLWFVTLRDLIYLDRLFVVLVDKESVKSSEILCASRAPRIFELD